VDDDSQQWKPVESSSLKAVDVDGSARPPTIKTGDRAKRVVLWLPRIVDFVDATQGCPKRSTSASSSQRRSTRGMEVCLAATELCRVAPFACRRRTRVIIVAKKWLSAAWGGPPLAWPATPFSPGEALHQLRLRRQQEPPLLLDLKRPLPLSRTFPLPPPVASFLPSPSRTRALPTQSPSAPPSPCPSARTYRPRAPSAPVYPSSAYPSVVHAVSLPKAAVGLGRLWLPLCCLGLRAFLSPCFAFRPASRLLAEVPGC